MRVLLTILLTLLFVVAFAAFFMLDSVARYAADPDAFVDTAREAKVRDTLIDVTEEFIHGEVQKDPALAGVSRAEVRAMIEGVITEQWFEQTVRAAHAEALAAVDDAREDAIIDLRDTKRELHAAVAELQHRAGTACAQLLGADTCADADRAALLVAAFRARADAAIDRIRDQVDIAAELSGHRGRSGAAGVTEIETVKRRLGDIRSWRWIGLGVLIACLALIALVNSSPLARLLRAVGIALVLGAALYLIAVSATSGYLREQATEHLSAVRDRHERLDRYDRMIKQGTERFTVELVSRSTSHSTGPVVLLGLIGLGALAGGLLLRKS